MIHYRKCQLNLKRSLKIVNVLLISYYFRERKTGRGGKGKVRRGERKECRQEKGRDSSKYLKYFKQLELVTLTSSLTKSPTNTL